MTDNYLSMLVTGLRRSRSAIERSPSSPIWLLKKLRNLSRGSEVALMCSQKAATPVGPIGLVASEKCSSRSQSENHAAANARTWVKRSTGHTHTHTPTENNTPDTDTHAHVPGRTGGGGLGGGYRRR